MKLKKRDKKDYLLSVLIYLIKGLHDKSISPEQATIHLGYCIHYMDTAFKKDEKEKK